MGLAVRYQLTASIRQNALMTRRASDQIAVEHLQDAAATGLQTAEACVWNQGLLGQYVLNVLAERQQQVFAHLQELVIRQIVEVSAVEDVQVDLWIAIAPHQGRV